MNTSLFKRQRLNLLLLILLISLVALAVQTNFFRFRQSSHQEKTITLLPSPVLRTDEAYLLLKNSHNDEITAFSNSKYNFQKVSFKADQLSLNLAQLNAHPWAETPYSRFGHRLVDRPAQEDFPENFPYEEDKVIQQSLETKTHLSNLSARVFHSATHKVLYQGYDDQKKTAWFVLFDTQANTIDHLIPRPYSGENVDVIDFHEDRKEIYAQLRFVDGNWGASYDHIREFMIIDATTGEIKKTLRVPYSNYLEVDETTVYDNKSYRLLLDSSHQPVRAKGALYLVDFLAGTLSKVEQWPLTHMDGSASDGKVLLYDEIAHVYQPYSIRRNFLTHTKIFLPTDIADMKGLELVQVSPSYNHFVFSATAKNNSPDCAADDSCQTCFWFRDWLSDGSERQCFTGRMEPIFLAESKGGMDSMPTKKCSKLESYTHDAFKLSFTAPGCFSYSGGEGGFALVDTSYPFDQWDDQSVLVAGTEAVRGTFDEDAEYWFRYYFSSTGTGWGERKPQVIKSRISYGGKNGVMYLMKFREAGIYYEIRRLFLPLSKDKIMEITIQGENNWPAAEKVLQSMKFL